MVFFAREYMWVPQHSRDTLFLSAVRNVFRFRIRFCLLFFNFHLIINLVRHSLYLDAWLHMCNWSDDFVDNGLLSIAPLSTSTCRWMWLHYWWRSWTNTNEFNTQIIGKFQFEFSHCRWWHYNRSTLGLNSVRVWCFFRSLFSIRWLSVEENWNTWLWSTI